MFGSLGHYRWIVGLDRFCLRTWLGLDLLSRDLGLWVY